MLGGAGAGSELPHDLQPDAPVGPCHRDAPSSAAIPDTVTVTGSDTQHDCHLLSLKRNQAQPRV